MTAENEFYYCEICGIVVRTLKGGAGTLVCCGQDMTGITEEQAQEMAQE